MRYWDVIDNEVNVRYWGSTFLGHVRHQDMLNNFIGIWKDLNLGLLYQLSMDVPNVNLKFYQEVTKKRKEQTFHSRLDIGSCSLHIIHGNFKTGAEKFKWNIKELSKGVFQVLQDSSVRREDYESITGSSKYLLYFCTTR